jgi:hypothetical protein
MIGNITLHYKTLEKLGEVLLRLSLHTKVDKTKVCFVGQGGSNNTEASLDKFTPHSLSAKLC